MIAESISFVIELQTFGIVYIHCVQKKNTHSQFLTYLNERCVDLNKNCSGYTQGTVDANNVEIKYSLRAMT